MKRRITPEQLQELTDEQKVKLKEWWKPEKFDIYFNINSHCSRIVLYSTIGPHGLPVIFHEGNTVMSGQFDYTKLCLPLLDIGQMIELLTDWAYTERKCERSLEIEYLPSVNKWEFNMPYISETGKQELVDELWEKVKEVL